MAGYGVGGAAAQGLQAGFDMGLRADDAALRRRVVDTSEARQARLDTEHADQLARTNARQEKVDALALEDRDLAATDKEMEDARYALAGLAHQYGSLAAIPQSEAAPHVSKVRTLAERRQQMLDKRHGPSVAAEAQWVKDTTSRLQAGQMSLKELSDADLRRLVKGSGYSLGDLLRPEGGKSRARQGIDDALAGIQTGNQGLLIQGANVIGAPEWNKGLGRVAPDGSTIVGKELVALVPAMPQQGQQPTAAQSPIQSLMEALNPSSQQAAPPQQPPPRVMPVLKITARHADGTEVTYDAPVTKGRGTGDADEVHPGFDLSTAMDRVGQLGVLEEWVNTPEVRARLAKAEKENPGPTTAEQAYAAVHGDRKALLADTDKTSQEIAAISKLAHEQFNGDFAAARAALKGGAETPLKQALIQSQIDVNKARAGKLAGGGVSAALGDLQAPAGSGDETVDFWANAVIAGDRDWQVGLARSKSGSALIEKVKRRVPQLAKEYGLKPSDIGTTRAQSAALAGAMKDLTKRAEAVELFSNKVEKDMKTFDTLLDKAATGAPMILSRPINVIRREFSSPEMAQLDLAAKQVGTEYERLITGGTLSIAQLHVGAQEDAKKLINGDMTPTQARAVMQTMRAEIKNAREAARESRVGIGEQMRGLGGPRADGAAPAAGGAPSAPAVGTVKSGYRFKGGNPADKANWERVQ